MKKKPSNSLHRKAFSLFEFMLFLSIFAMILASSLPRFKSRGDEMLCIHKLRAKLMKANSDFSHLYTQSILQSSQPTAIAPILDELTTEEKSCFFEYKRGKLFAKIGRKTLPFEISPKDFKSKPKIYCSLSNELCRIFWQKTMKK